MGSATSIEREYLSIHFRTFAPVINLISGTVCEKIAVAVVEVAGKDIVDGSEAVRPPELTTCECFFIHLLSVDLFLIACSVSYNPCT